MVYYKCKSESTRGDIMEHPSKNDFFMEFKPIFNEKKEFVEYILTGVSDNFKKVTNLKPENILGQKLCRLIAEKRDNGIIIEDLYYHMSPSTRRKFEKFINYLGRWYLISIFGDEKNYLLLFYIDITRFKSQTEDSQTDGSAGYGYTNLRKMV